MALQASPSPAQEVGLPAETGLALSAAVAAAGLLWAAKSVAWVPTIGEAGLAAAVFAQLWWPVSLCDRRGVTLAAVGLGATGGGQPVGRQLVGAAAVLAVVLPVYAWASHAWWSGGARALAAWGQGHGILPPGLAGAAAVWRLSPPPLAATAWARVAGEVVGQVLGAALPEEVFFRGYLRPQLCRRWPPAGAVGALVGRAACLSAAFFALGHWLGEWRPERLLTFFPGLLFGAVAGRQGGVTGAIALHAGCNLFAAGWAACWTAAA